MKKESPPSSAGSSLPHHFLLLLCSTSQVFAAAKVNLKNTKIKLSATKLTYNQKSSARR